MMFFGKNINSIAGGIIATAIAMSIVSIVMVGSCCIAKISTIIV